MILWKHNCKLCGKEHMVSDAFTDTDLICSDCTPGNFPNKLTQEEIDYGLKVDERLKNESK